MWIREGVREHMRDATQRREMHNGMVQGGEGVKG